MAKIQSILGKKRKKVEVDAWPFLPGLYAHETLDADTTGRYSITHRGSGLMILDNVVEESLEPVRAVLGKLLWDKDEEEVFKNENYYHAITEAKLLTNHQKSEKQEKRVAKDLDGKRQPASGSRWGYKRDVVTPRFSLEAKTTKANRHAVSFKDLSFIKRQAYMTGKIPVYLVSLLDTSEVAILPDQDVGDEDLPDTTTFASIACQITAKNITVTLEMVKSCIDGTVLRIKHGRNKFVMMGYENFLEFAKKGVE